MPKLTRPFSIPIALLVTLIALALCATVLTGVSVALGLPRTLVLPVVLIADVITIVGVWIWARSGADGRYAGPGFQC